jgi:hypothetical protein
MAVKQQLCWYEVEIRGGRTRRMKVPLGLRYFGDAGFYLGADYFAWTSVRSVRAFLPTPPLDLMSG